MNVEGVALIIAYVEQCWPHTPMTDERAEIFGLELQDLDFDLTQAVLRAEFGANDFPPTPIALRNAVARATGGSLPEADEVYNEIMNAIQSVGYAQPEPAWSHPAISALVQARGGWRRLCESAPTRSAIDASAVSAANTFRAQLRDEWNARSAREQHRAARSALPGSNAVDTAILATRKEID